MHRSLQIAGAYVGLIVGAGFASGQEVLQFFTSFGVYSFIGIGIALLLFAFLGMQVTGLGSELQTLSHKKVIYHICGKYIGRVIDLLITFFLFGVATVMIAGSGSIFQQQFGISPAIGAFILTILVIFTLILDVRNIISIISIITPFLLILIFMITIYSIFISDTNPNVLTEAAKSHPSAAPHWALGGLLYVSYNIAAGVSMLAIIGGTVKDQKVARLGGALGGIGLGVLLLLINLAMYFNIEKLANIDMPTLFLATEISPIIGLFMSLALLGMIFNTAVGMLYAFTARFVASDTKPFKIGIIVVSLLSFAASFVGFIELVGTVYPITGYLGFALIIALILYTFRRKRLKTSI